MFQVFTQGFTALSTYVLDAYNGQQATNDWHNQFDVEGGVYNAWEEFYQSTKTPPETQNSWYLLIIALVAWFILRK